MFERAWNAISDWPVVLQGAAGSFIFWLLGRALGLLRRPVKAGMEQWSESAARDAALREYVYLRYTSLSGMANYLQGYGLSFRYAMRYLLRGLLFVCLALAIGGLHPVVLGIVLGTAAWHFLRSLAWLAPHDDPKDRWSRIVELEKSLFGAVQQDTTEMLQRRVGTQAEETEAADPERRVAGTE